MDCLVVDGLGKDCPGVVPAVDGCGSLGDAGLGGRLGGCEGCLGDVVGCSGSCEG